MVRESINLGFCRGIGEVIIKRTHVLVFPCQCRVPEITTRVIPRFSQLMQIGGVY